MELADLPLFLAVTRHGSLQGAADEVHLTPSALSRAIRRLETSLRTPLFDRSGRALRLNAEGERLRQRALALVDLAEQTRAEFRGTRHRVHCRIAAPGVLQWTYADALAGALAVCGPQASLALAPVFEDEALAQLARGEVELALVSAQALASGPNGHVAAALEQRPLGTLRMRLACGPDHALAKHRRVALDAVLDADFAAPTRSLFCGLPRGGGSDGWREDRLPRRVRYWVDDLQVLVDLVRRGHALAYLPEAVLARGGLRALEVEDCPYTCEEQALLLWRPAQASGWLQRFVDAMGVALTAPPTV
jgi:DNA-binding transcriptional LysR family regulator